MIEIQNVSFSYEEGTKTLNNVNLHISQGECVLLCGASGCGKTTITKLINGLRAVWRAKRWSRDRP